MAALTLTVAPDISPVGQGVQLTATVTDDTGTAADPATLTLTIVAPDGTSSTIPIGSWTRTATGVYSYTTTPAVAGFYVGEAVTTIPAAAAETSWRSAGIGYGAASLDRFKNYLNVTSNSSLGGDSELQLFLDTAVELVDFEVGGDVIPRARSERHHGGRPAIVLNHPIVSVQTVTEWVGRMSWTITEQELSSDPATWTNYGYTVDGQTLTRRVGGYGGVWQPGRYNIAVNYTSGLPSLPRNVETAIYELALHLFQSQQGSRMTNTAEDWTPAKAYAMPNRVRELLEPQRRLPGIG